MNKNAIYLVILDILIYYLYLRYLYIISLSLLDPSYSIIHSYHLSIQLLHMLYIYITIYSSLLLSNIHKYIHIYTLTKPLFLLSTTKLTIPILILHFIYTFTTTIALPILLPLLSFTLITITKAYHSVISNIFTVI